MIPVYKTFVPTLNYNLMYASGRGILRSSYIKVSSALIMNKIKEIFILLIKFVCISATFALSPSALANEMFAEEAVNNFLKKANYSGNIIEADGVRSGIAVANYQRGSKTEKFLTTTLVNCSS